MTDERHLLRRYPFAKAPEKRVLSESEFDGLDEYHRMRLSLRYHDVPKDIADGILAAYHDPEWDWTKRSDGCTAVSELGFPKGYRFPPCVEHDYNWWRVRARKDISAWEANVRFYRAQAAYGKPIRGLIRTAGVMVSWFCYFRWFR